MSINALEKKGYPKDYGTAINLSGSMLASVIPPSILMINAAATANVSIGQALLAGLIPGILIGIVFMIYNYLYCKKHKIGDRVPFKPQKLRKAFVSAIPALLTPVILLGAYTLDFIRRRKVRQSLLYIRSLFYLRIQKSEMERYSQNYL